jgi:hypothetical protein
MSSINTNKYRTFLAQQFRTTLLLSGADSTVKADITSTNTSLMSAGAATTSEFYLGVGRPQTWTSDVAPPAPTQDTQSLDFAAWRDLLGAKHITANNSALVIARHDWAADTVYTQYDDTNASLMSNTFYVLDTSELPYKVYKCLWNNTDATHVAGANSTVAPSTTGSTNDPKLTADGYVWKYMYTIETADYTYLTAAWMPVMTNSTVSADATTYAGKLSTVVPLVVTTGGSAYTNASAVTVSLLGDGTNATINGASGTAGITFSANAVANVSFYAGGTGYTTIDAITLKQSGSSNTAAVRALIPPYPNHGHDAAKELGCVSVMLTTELAYAEAHGNSSMTVANEYRRVMLLRDPLLADGNAANGVFYQQTYDCTLTSNTATFEPDDVVTVTTNSTMAYVVTGTVVDVIKSSDPEASVVRITNVHDGGRTAAGDVAFANTDIITTSGVSAVLGTIRVPELKTFSGNILYIDQRVPVARSDAQVEEVRLVFGF